MESVNQKKIRLQSALRICGCLFHGDATRAQLARACSLSLMTVGKIVEILKEAGVLEEKKEESPFAGRKAGSLSVRREHRVLVLDLTGYGFRLHSVPPGVPEAEMQSCEYPYNPAESYGANLALALEQFSAWSASQTGTPCGLAVLVPGPYHRDADTVFNKRIPELTQLHLMAELVKSFPELPIFIEEDVRYAARSAVKQIPGYGHKTVFYMYIGQGAGGALVQHGSIPATAFSYASDFGQLRCGAHTVEFYLSADRLRIQYPGQREWNAGFFAQHGNDHGVREFLLGAQAAFMECFHSIMWLLDPHVILLDAPMFREVPGFLEKTVHGFLAQADVEREGLIPEFSFCGSGKNFGLIGARDTVRQKWIESFF